MSPEEIEAENDRLRHVLAMVWDAHLDGVIELPPDVERAVVEMGED